MRPESVQSVKAIFGRMLQEKRAYLARIKSRDASQENIIAESNKYIHFLNGLLNEWQRLGRPSLPNSRYPFDVSIKIELSSAYQSIAEQCLVLKTSMLRGGDRVSAYRYVEQAYDAAKAAYDFNQTDARSNSFRFKLLCNAADAFCTSLKEEAVSRRDREGNVPALRFCKSMAEKFSLAIQFVQAEPIQDPSVFSEAQRQVIITRLQVTELWFYLFYSEWVSDSGDFTEATRLARYAFEKSEMYLPRIVDPEFRQRFQDVSSKLLHYFCKFAQYWLDQERLKVYAANPGETHFPHLTFEQIETYLTAPLRALERAWPMVCDNKELVVYFTEVKAKICLSLSNTKSSSRVEVLSERLHLLMLSHQAYLQARALIDSAHSEYPNILHMLSTVARSIAKCNMDLSACAENVDQLNAYVVDADKWANAAVDYAALANDLRKGAAGYELLAEINTHPYFVIIPATEDEIPTRRSVNYLQQAILMQIQFLRDAKQWSDPVFIGWMSREVLPQLLNMFLQPYFDAKGAGYGDHVDLFRLYVLLRGLQHSLLRLCDKTPELKHGQNARSLFEAAANYSDLKPLFGCSRVLVTTREYAQSFLRV